MADDRDMLRARFGKAPPQASWQPPEAERVIPIHDTLSERPSVLRPGFDQIKLKIRRDQHRSAAGVTFSVHFIAELSPDALEAVQHYRFGKAVLYEKDLSFKFTMNLFRLLWRIFYLWLTRKSWQINVNDLTKGRTMKCKSILEVLEVEENITQAAKTFAQILRAASWFGGEEVIDL